MSFVFPILMGGLALTAIPVLLHLIVRQKPRMLRFPALRFLIQKQHTNQRRLRLQHFLLLLLRVLLIAAMCLALAQPRFFHQGLSLDSARPIAAIFVFDTSASMGYQSSEITRLDEAKKRALELIDKLPEGSRFLILDSADILQPHAEEPWLHSADATRKKIVSLKIRPSNAPITRTLESALRKFDALARQPEDLRGRRLLRLVGIFSDRTPGSWDASQLAPLDRLRDKIPPLYEGLRQAQDRFGTLRDLLRELRDQLPPAGKDYPDQSLQEILGELQEATRGLRPEDLPANETIERLLQKTSELSRTLYDQIRYESTETKDPKPDYRLRLRTLLDQILQNLAGVEILYFDVGIEQPIDLALLRLDLPRDERGVRQVFVEGDKIPVQAVVRATGKDLSDTLIFQIAGQKIPQPIELKKDQTLVLPPIEIDTSALKLTPGPQQLEVRFETSNDALPFNNQRFLTFLIRERRRVLVLADDPERARIFSLGLESVGAKVVTQAMRDKLPPLSEFQAICLVGVSDPTPLLWQTLEPFVRQGGGLAIVPAGDDLKPAAFTHESALRLMPGRFGDKTLSPEPGATWNWRDPQVKYGHPFLQAFRIWKENSATDFMVYPRSANAYWDIQPDQASSILMRYQPGARPALLAREVGRGQVLLFTTPLDRQVPAWHNYDENLTAFYVALCRQTLEYLCGEIESRPCNFALGRDEIQATLPPGANFPRYSLIGPAILENVKLTEQGQLALKTLHESGNYLLQGINEATKERRPLAGFSLNLPEQESDLSRVPEAEVERLCGTKSIVPLSSRVTLQESLKEHWSEPIDLFPAFMLLLLLVLAIEGLFANKFYRQPSTEG